ncbi:hypothetical protein J1C56_25495 [Aminobacter anthyllidis]|uniref:Lipoprotein n=1 Tax=Aminobacter anthyllidis TaxID=1035067 RepID=A0A9X1AFC4_9HYPH|nr:hypothetical protein [Aminobacter anthyllidis]MBT1158934.1 hypothetical protein [Aminobacter anthyllidis]
MRAYLRVFASGLLLSGCANGGAFVSTGSVNYGALVGGLRCEVEDVIAYDRRETTSAKFFYDGNVAMKRQANIVVKINGQFNRDAGFSLGLEKYGIGRADLVSASAGLSGRIDETGTVVMGDTVVPDESKCDRGRTGAYDLSRLSLLAWYKSVSARVEDKAASSYLSEMTYYRNGSVVFGRNGLAFSFLTPGTISPGLGFTAAQSAEITIVFADMPSERTTKIDPKSLEALAEIIRSGGRKGAGGGRTGADATSPAEILRDRQIDTLNDRLKTLIIQPRL